jgi:hypothetical protein
VRDIDISESAMKSDSAFQRPLERALVHALAHLRDLDRSPVAATASLEALRERLERPLESAGVPPERVIDDLVTDVAGGG